jgi:hypothetical protein
MHLMGKIEIRRDFDRLTVQRTQSVFPILKIIIRVCVGKFVGECSMVSEYVELGERTRAILF